MTIYENQSGFSKFRILDGEFEVAGGWAHDWRDVARSAGANVESNVEDGTFTVVALTEDDGYRAL